MGIDMKKKGGKLRNRHRKDTPSPNVYVRLLVKLYKFLARRTESNFNKTVLRRLMLSRNNRALMSLSRLVKYTRKTDLEGKIVVVVGSVTDDTRLSTFPKMTLCALRVTETARRRILASGGEILTFDQLALQRPTGSNTMLLRGCRTHRKAYKYFGAAGVPNSKALHKMESASSKGRKFEKARGARSSRGYVN